MTLDLKGKRVTYAFTAFWKNYDEAYLEKNGTQRIITPSNPG